MPFGKRRVYSVSGRHHDDRWQKTSDVFRKAYKAFYYFRSLPSTHGKCRIEYRHRTKCFKVHYTSFTLNRFMCATSTSTNQTLSFQIDAAVNLTVKTIYNSCFHFFCCSSAFARKALDTALHFLSDFYSCRLTPHANMIEEPLHKEVQVGRFKFYFV